MLRFLLYAAAVLALAGCGSGDPESRTTAPMTTPAPATPGGGPDISGAGLDNEALSTQDFRGKPVFVNVWSSW